MTCYLAVSKIYALIPLRGNIVKIGRSSDIHTRIKHLSKKFSFPQALINSGWDGTREKEIHKILRFYSVPGMSECFYRYGLVNDILLLMLDGPNGFFKIPDLLHIDEIEYILEYRENLERQRSYHGKDMLDGGYKTWEVDYGVEYYDNVGKRRPFIGV